MATGTAVQQVAGQPTLPFVMDPVAFDLGTQKNVIGSSESFDAPGPGKSEVSTLIAAGVAAELYVTFEGTLTSVNGTGAVATTDRWPYGLLDNISTSINAANGLIDVLGEELYVRRFLTNPAMVEGVDVFAGTLGGGDADLGDLTDDPVYLTWHVPIVLDMTTLIGAIYAQSSQTKVLVRSRQALNADLVTLTGDATFEIDGTFTITPIIFDIPIGPNGEIITPSIDRRHGFRGFDREFSNTGEVPTTVQRLNGQVLRLLLQVRRGDDDIVQPLSSDGDFERLALRYGGNKKPIEFDPVEVLTSINNAHYGAPLPYGYLCFDFLRENAKRDLIDLPGVTDLQILTTLASSTTLGTNPRVRYVLETVEA